MMSRLILGTAQFGSHYGVANHSGQISADEAKKILDIAQSNGVRFIDTAVSYGASERVLGKMGLCDFEMITKLPKVPEHHPHVEHWLLTEISESLERLQVSSLYGVLLHYPDQLLGPQGDAIYNALCAAKKLGLVYKIGVSIYQPSELDALLQYRKFDLIQAPFSVLDRRLATSGWLEKLQNLGIEVHVRSIFLQGLLLMSPEQRPAYFGRWSQLLSRYDQWLEEHRIHAIAACLRFVLTYPAIHKLIIGVDSSMQLQQIIGASVGPVPPLPLDLHCGDIELLNPSLWRMN